MITPSIGRQVWFWPPTRAAIREEQPCAATVVYVHDNRCVNLYCLDHFGNSFQVHNVQLLQDDEPVLLDIALNYGYAEWMPYQKKVAATS